MGEVFTLHVVGEAENTFSGSRPNVDELLKPADSNTKALLYKALEKIVDMHCQAGDPMAAIQAIRSFQEKQFEYASPLNRFPRDDQFGGRPYIGAHCVFGAIRDAMHSCWDFTLKRMPAKPKPKKKKGETPELAIVEAAENVVPPNPSATHLKNFVQVRPHHIFLYRPDLNGHVIEEVDGIEGQQPIGKVSGFSKFEVIHPPFQFQFRISVVGMGLFSKLTEAIMRDVVKQAVNHGLGARRGVGYGVWKMLSCETVGEVTQATAA